MLSEIRIGKFTSSEISKLTANGKKSGEFGKPFHTYVKQKKQERKLKRSLSIGEAGRASQWGKLVEHWLMYERPEIIGMEYTLTPSLTVAHHEFKDSWCGSRDGFNNNTKAVIDLKCPYTLGSFADFADCATIEEVRTNTQSGEDYYWQLVSNAAIAGVKKAELIIFMPTLSQLNEIQLYAHDGLHEMSNINWIYSTSTYDMPYLPEDSEYKNIIRFEFEISDGDLQFLTERVKIASEFLK